MHDSYDSLGPVVDRAVEHVIQNYDSLIREGWFYQCNEILRKINTTLPSDILLAHLMITMPYKDKLQNRSEAFHKIEEAMTKRLGKEKAEKLIAPFR